jgi:elongation factor P--beta-lysine ligase
MIEELVSGKADEAVISGRVIGILDGEGVILGLPEDFVGEKGFILKDESEKIVVLSELLPGIGSIIEAKVVKAGAGKCRLVGEFEFLAECEDFYVSLRESPNYKKMVVDMNLAEKLKLRGKIVQGIRDYFLGLGFLETDTPCMVRLPGMEPYLDVFKTRFEANFDAAGKISEEMYLITSPEYAMKKLLVGGLEKIFQITKSFRNKESFSERHNPEFSILEWYRSYASYLEMMEDTEGLVKYLWDKYGQRDENVQLVKVKYKGHEVDVMQTWERLKVIDSFAKYAGISNEVFLDLEKLRAAVIGKGYKVDETTSFDDLFFLVFMNEIEPRLGLDKPVIL